MARGTSEEVISMSPGGVREDLNPAAIPDGFFEATTNWVNRNGVGRPRPGYGQVGSTLDEADTILAIGFRGSSRDGDNIVIHSLSAGYHWNGSSLASITGSWTTASVTDNIRLITFNSSGTTLMVRAAPNTSISVWDGTAASFVTASGAPTAWDCMAIGNRVLAMRVDGDPLKVAWCGNKDIGDWDLVNDFARLDDMPGNIVGGAPLGPFTGAIYKEDSIWVAQLQASTEPFQFQMVAPSPGPMSARSIVHYGGSHYWLAEDLNIYRFDGTAVSEPLSAGLSITLQNEFDFNKAEKCHGFTLDIKSPEITFVYPRIGVDSMDHAFTFNVVTQAINFHEYAADITTASRWTAQPGRTIDDLASLVSTVGSLMDVSSTIDGLGLAGGFTALLGDSTGSFYRYGIDLDDDGTPISWDWKTGWRAISGLEARTFLDGIASYWKKLASSFTVTLEIESTDTLGEDEVVDTRTFELSASSNHLTHPTDDTLAQWYRIKMSGQGNQNGLACKGAVVLGWPRPLT